MDYWWSDRYDSVMCEQIQLLKKLQQLPENPTDEEVLGVIVETYAATDRELRFIQLGAYDGSGDIFQEKFLWAEDRPYMYGILVEPSPAAYSRLNLLVNNRPELAKRVICLNKAAHPTGGTKMDFYQVDELRLFQEVNQNTLARPEIQPGSFQRISSFDPQHLVKHLEQFTVESKLQMSSDEYLERFGRTISVETITAIELISCLTELVGLNSSVDISSIDLLIIDIEGIDLAVMESFFAASIFPNAILYEDVHLDRAESISLLSEYGYKNINLYGYNSLGVRLT